MCTPPTNPQRPASIHEVSAALRRNDVPGAEMLFDSVKRQSSAILSAADSAMSGRRWDEAVWFLDRIPQRDVGASIKRCLSLNLACLHKHRPDIYKILVSLSKSNHCGIGTASCGHPTIVVCRADGQNIALSPGNKPLEAVVAALVRFKPALDSGQAISLCGIGDGYLFHQIAQQSPRLFMDTEQNIFLLEPDAHLVLTAFMIHNFTGANGAIEQARFHWFIGPDWDRSLHATLLNDFYFSPPVVSALFGLNPEPIQTRLNEIIADLAARDQTLGEVVDRYYKNRKSSEIAEALSDNPPRKPRVLFLTTRFSTVLQYATRDAAEGCEQAGFETRVMIEPTPRHRIMRAATRAALAEFKPDLVFQIDHQRQEHDATLFPANLPFVCWIQDHMPHLMKKDAGNRITASDFVLSDAGPVYVRNFDYPQRQIIAVSKLTALPPLLPRSVVPSRDLIFVSNASHTTDDLLDRLIKAFPAGTMDLAFLEECVRRMVTMHAADGSLPTYRDVCAYLRGLIAELGIELTASQFDRLTWQVNHPICDALYRQQTVRWIVGAAQEMGLPLKLYGQGWDRHAEFAPFARGTLTAGRELNEVCRNAAINFQIAPYLCLHQRMLDGISSGAFFLVRRHVSDVAPQQLLHLLETHCTPRANQLQEARDQMPPGVRERFDALVKSCWKTLTPFGDEDPIEMVRTWHEAGLLVSSGEVLPHLDSISFSDASELKGRISRFIADPDLRERIVDDARQSIANRLTYAATMKRVARSIGKSLAQQSASSTRTIPSAMDAVRAA